MKTTVATALALGSAKSAASTLATELRAKLRGTTPALLMVFASTKQPLAEVTALLGAEFPGTTLLASSTCGEFTEHGDAKGSVCAFAVSGDFRCYAGIGGNLKADAEGAVREALEGLPRELNGYPHTTAILLLDPLAGNGEETTLIAASILGDSVRLAGGAAGDDLEMKDIKVGVGARVASDAVVIGLIFSKRPLGLGVCHGHEPLSAPMKVTRAEGNVVYEVDGRPAWPVWLEQTKARAAMRGIDVATLTKDGEGAFLLRYEAGLAAGGNDYKIRAPLSRKADGSISFACGIPEGSVIRITESLPERQVHSAREAARRARAQLKDGAAAGAVVFDCICRSLILEKDFASAVRGMSEELGNAPLAGFEALGEIALNADDMSGFHNTTSVVLAFPD